MTNYNGVKLKAVQVPTESTSHVQGLVCHWFSSVSPSPRFSIATNTMPPTRSNSRHNSIVCIYLWKFIATRVTWSHSPESGAVTLSPYAPVLSPLHSVRPTYFRCRRRSSDCLHDLTANWRCPPLDRRSRQREPQMFRLAVD